MTKLILSTSYATRLPQSDYVQLTLAKEHHGRRDFRSKEVGCPEV